ncbi:SCO-spondin-like isoform X2 [Montipora foliosa]|uniref:SCO-spondin-like isoform X2 n=1 Tax=Montipora foliosa TaxID=591990 RepID=UPI0035F1524E
MSVSFLRTIYHNRTHAQTILSCIFHSMLTWLVRKMTQLNQCSEQCIQALRSWMIKDKLRMNDRNAYNGTLWRWIQTSTYNRPVNCTVGSWESWGSCSYSLSLSRTQWRTRQITRAASHGGTCPYSLSESRACPCPAGYTGSLCLQDINECLRYPNPCQHRCSNTYGSYTCQCYSCYTKRGTRCVLRLRQCRIWGSCYLYGTVNPNNQCQDCQSTNKMAWTNNNALPCNDGVACTRNDRCSNGSCAGTPFTCLSCEECYNEACHVKTGFCAIQEGWKKVCSSHGDIRPGYPCQWCDPSISTSTWSNRQGVACNDGDQCTRGDTCQSGHCTATPFTCNSLCQYCNGNGCSLKTGFGLTNVCTCKIGGQDYNHQTVNPSNQSEWCNLYDATARAKGAWSNHPVACRPVNGGWSSWGAWNSCNKSCGMTSQSRFRSCTNPFPRYCGRSCQGSSRQSKLCRYKPCPVNGGWSSWGGWDSCSRTCGTGSQNRYRSCSKPPPRYGGISCTGTSRQSKSCTIKPCPVNGGWSSWGGWRSCSRTCGSGSQNRYRSCSNPPPRNGGISCPGTSRQSKLCNIKPCPVNGGWSSWRGWGSCSRTCGTGSQNRYRSCSNPPPSNGGISCIGSSRQSTSCTIKPCPVNGGWSSWSKWNSCSMPCGTGSQERSRSCTKPPPRYGGKSCLGTARDKRSCNHLPCPVDGDWSSWSTWTTCSRSCDSGIEVRTRSCSKPLPQYGGKKCPGAANQQRECNTHSCPVNGGWSAWFVSRPCSLSCGGGTEILSRTCTNPAPKHGGEFCQGDTRKEQVCASNPCPVQGGWSSWSVLTPCSVTCGNGTEILSRTCTNPEPKHGGEFCQGDTQKRQVCTQKPCPVDGGWSSWDIWSPCTKTCEFGTQIRIRNCSQPRAQYGGKTCPGAAVEERVCNSHLCPVDGGWSEWSGWTDCSVTCGNGTKSRARNCNNPAPIAGGRHCKGLSEDVKSCNASNICYDNIGCYGRFPRSSLLRGFRDEIEWFKPPLKKQMDKVVEKCSRIAMKERLTFFAVEDYGNCYGTQEFFAGSVPKSFKCNFGVGLENFFYVYKVFL